MECPNCKAIKEAFKIGIKTGFSVSMDFIAKEYEGKTVFLEDAQRMEKINRNILKSWTSVDEKPIPIVEKLTCFEHEKPKRKK